MPQKNEYRVEKILKKRVKNNVVEYFLKWYGWPDSENSWEPESNLACSDLLQEFNQRACLNNNPIIPMEISTSSLTNIEYSSRTHAFPSKNTKQARNRPEKIIGVTSLNSEDFYLVKPKGKDILELIHMSKAYQDFPQMIIDFYQKRASFL